MDEEQVFPAVLPRVGKIPHKLVFELAVATLQGDDLEIGGS